MKSIFSISLFLFHSLLWASPICLEHSNREKDAQLLLKVISKRYQLPVSLIQINKNVENCLLRIKVNKDGALDLIQVKKLALKKMLISFR